MLGTLAPSQPCLTWWCTTLAPHPTSLQSDGDASQQLHVVQIPPQVVVMVMVMANEQDEEVMVTMVVVVMVTMVVVVMVMVMERREMMMVVNDGEMVEVMVEMMMDPPSWGL